MRARGRVEGEEILDLEWRTKRKTLLIWGMEQPSYIGQTMSLFKTPLKEHIADTSHNSISKSPIHEHSHDSKHLVCFDQTKILVSIPFYSSRIIREVLEIEKHPHNFNHEDTYKLSRCWKPIIHCLCHWKFYPSYF